MRTQETDCLVIRRSAGAEKGFNRTVCRPRCVTVLTDADGASLPKYQKALCGEPAEETIIFEYNGASFNPSQQLRIGFGDQLPEDKGIKEFISEFGVSEEEVEKIVDACDLRKHLYYKCAQLSSTQARQLLLLKALHSSEKVVVLNDPFQPFNGRWREYFAEALLNNIQERDRILIVINLSFIPQSWSNKEVVKEADVGKIVRPESSLKDMMKAQNAAEQDVAALDAATLERQAKATFRIPVPEPLRYAFTETRDFIFEPLARVSGTFRGYNTGIFLLVFAGLIALGSHYLLGKVNGNLAQNLVNFSAGTQDGETTAKEDITRKVNLGPEEKRKVVDKTEHPEEVAGAGEAAANESDAESLLVSGYELDQSSDENVTHDDYFSVDSTLMGGPLCLTEYDQFNMWYWTELPPVEEPLYTPIVLE